MKRKSVPIIVSIAIIIVVLLFSCFKIQMTQKKVIKIGIIDSYISKETLESHNITSINYTNNCKETDNLHGRITLNIVQKECKHGEIYYASVLDKDNTSSIDNIISAIDWCIEKDVDIICMSFATATDNSMLKKSVENATRKGIIITSSCFNMSNVDCYPAMYKNVISVSEGMNKNATIIIKNKKYKIELDGKNYEKTGTSITNAYVCGYIANELSKGKISLNEVIKKLNS